MVENSNGSLIEKSYTAYIYIYIYMHIYGTASKLDGLSYNLINLKKYLTNSNVLWN